MAKGTAQFFNDKLINAWVQRKNLEEGYLLPTSIPKDKLICSGHLGETPFCHTPFYVLTEVMPVAVLLLSCHCQLSHCHYQLSLSAGYMLFSYCRGITVTT